MKNSSFCLFRIPENGGRVLWEITNTCNYSCSYCIFNSLKTGNENELSTSEIFSVLKDLRKKNFSHIKFTGGEPFIRKDIMDILEKSIELGFNVDISTNGSLIDFNMAKRLKELNIRMAHISLDGYNKKQHEMVRGQGTFDKTIKGIKNLTDNNVYTRIGTVIFKENENHLADIIELAIMLRANEIIFSFMEPVGRLKGDYTLISQKPIIEVKAELENLSDRYAQEITVNYSFTEETKNANEGACPAVNKFLYIDNLGRISPCTWIVEKYPEYKSIKTLKDSTFDDVINSEPIMNYLEFATKCQKGCPVKRR